MNAELTLMLHQKYPAIFRNQCGFGIGDGWYAIIDTTCAAMTEAYSTCIHVDEERAKALDIKPQIDSDGHPYYPLRIECPQVVAVQIKEKYGTLRFYFRLEFDPRFQELAFGKNPMLEATRIAHGYDSFMAGIEHMAETLSARTCEETGREGELHVSGGSLNGGWWRTLNREYAKTDPHCRNRNYVPVTDLPLTKP
jgi:hypothetical protein